MSRTKIVPCVRPTTSAFVSTYKYHNQFIKYSLSDVSFFNIASTSDAMCSHNMI